MMNKPVVFVNGCFDMFHEGHKNFLYLTGIYVGMNGILVIGLDSNARVAGLKGEERPIDDFLRRKIRLVQEFPLKLLILEMDCEPIELACKIKPDIIVRGWDQRIDDMGGYNDRIIQLQRFGNDSTTGILKKMQEVK